MLCYILLYNIILYCILLSDYIWHYPLSSKTELGKVSLAGHRTAGHCDERAGGLTTGGISRTGLSGSTQRKPEVQLNLLDVRPALHAGAIISALLLACSLSSCRGIPLAQRGDRVSCSLSRSWQNVWIDTRANSPKWFKTVLRRLPRIFAIAFGGTPVVLLFVLQLSRGSNKNDGCSSACFFFFFDDDNDGSNDDDNNYWLPYITVLLLLLLLLRLLRLLLLRLEPSGWTPTTNSWTLPAFTFMFLRAPRRRLQSRLRGMIIYCSVL